MISEISRTEERWREYQKRIQRIARRKYLLRRLPRLGLYGGISFLIMVIIFYGGSWIFAHLERGEISNAGKDKKREIWPKSLKKKDLPSLLNQFKMDLLLATGNYVVTKGGVKLTVETFINPALQKYILDLLERSLTQQAAVVVLRPDNGQVLAMANYEKEGTREKRNLCLKANFPAASLFKIVSAAAAIEKKGFTPEKTVVFRGRKHTLYKSQLKRAVSRYSIKTSFKKAFSNSINPVFGKIGIYNLGKGFLEEYADRFFFNQGIPFDLPLAKSEIHVPEDDFGLAEIASGFNKRTLISPLHATLITAAVANNGTMMEPSLVKKVTDESGRPLYRARPAPMGRPIGETTSEKLKVLMEDTVRSGTCRKAFRPLRRKKVFRGIELGAKTGTINDPSDHYKYDWLTAYALPKNGGQGISITVLAIHGEKLGIRANDLARYIINYHFTS